MSWVLLRSGILMQQYHTPSQVYQDVSSWLLPKGTFLQQYAFVVPKCRVVNFAGKFFTLLLLDDCHLSLTTASMHSSSRGVKWWVHFSSLVIIQPNRLSPLHGSRTWSLSPWVTWFHLYLSSNNFGTHLAQIFLMPKWTWMNLTTVPYDRGLQAISQKYR